MHVNTKNTQPNIFKLNPVTYKKNNTLQPKGHNPRKAGWFQYFENHPIAIYFVVLGSSLYTLSVFPV